MLIYLGTSLVLITIVIYWFSKRNAQYFIYNVGNEATIEVTFEHRKFFPRIWRKVKQSSHIAKMCVSSLIIVVGSTAIVYPGFMSLVVACESTGKTEDAWVGKFYKLSPFNRVLQCKFQKCTSCL